MQFPIQRIQTDRGLEFFAYKFQDRLKEYAIKFRPIKLRSPQLNGKVERAQRTDLEEFYLTVNVQDPNLHEKLADWQDYYNEFRPHGSLNGKTPWERWWELANKTPFADEVEAIYNDSKKHLRLQNYCEDLYWTLRVRKYISPQALTPQDRLAVPELLIIRKLFLFLYWYYFHHTISTRQFLINSSHFRQ